MELNDWKLIFGATLMGWALSFQSGGFMTAGVMLMGWWMDGKLAKRK